MLSFTFSSREFRQPLSNNPRVANLQVPFPFLEPLQRPDAWQAVSEEIARKRFAVDHDVDRTPEGVTAGDPENSLQYFFRQGSAKWYLRHLSRSIPRKHGTRDRGKRLVSFQTDR